MESIELSSKAFSKMHNLRFLRFYGCRCRFRANHCSIRYILSDGLDFLPEKLTYVDWKHYPLKYLPLRFCPKNLVELRLDYGHLDQLWWNEDQPFENLNVLSLNYCKSLKRISNSFEAPKLEKLYLRGCEKLVEIPSLVPFERLETLDLCWCVKLEECPHVPCNLTDLYLDETPIKQLPSSISQLRNLVELSCKKCEGLMTLPPLTGLNSLVKLYLDKSGISEIPESIGSLISLRNLSLIFCKRLRNLPELPKCLTVVDASDCTSLEFASCPSLSQEDINREVVIRFNNCTNLNKEAHHKIMEDASSYSNKKEFQLWIPGLELWPKMRYKTSGARISFETERHHRIIGFHFSVVFDPQLCDFLCNFDAAHSIKCDMRFVDTFGEVHHFQYPVYLYPDLSSEHVIIWYRTFNSKDHVTFTHASFEFGCEMTDLDGVTQVKLGRSGGVIGCGVEPRLE